MSFGVFYQQEHEAVKVASSAFIHLWMLDWTLFVSECLLVDAVDADAI